VCHTTENLTTYFFFLKTQGTWIFKRGGKNNTGEGAKGKKARTISDDAGGKSVSEKSKSTGGKCG
jgi:hypothetical protein